ncbi:MAG TPA: hypothetical protein VFR58_12350 [Flavisolibacter sp.]|nr:hypothetical protein [Flavisolibacter sp.]
MRRYGSSLPIADLILDSVYHIESEVADGNARDQHASKQGWLHKVTLTDMGIEAI